MTKPYFKAANWNVMEQQVDKSAWSRLNDIVYEPGRIPLHKDKKEFLTLSPIEQKTLLHSFGSLSLSSTLQMQKGISAIKQDAVNAKEAAVFNALQYLESINNKSYSYALDQLGTPDQRDEAYKWADENPYLQQKMYFLNTVYQSGTSLQKKVAQVFISTALYHSAFFASLYLFGQGKLPRTAELIKCALRVTSFNGMYPGIKFRIAFNELSKDKQEKLHEWIYDLADQMYENEEKHIAYMYQNTGWADMVNHYVKYSLNKALMNLGQDAKYPETADNIDPVVMQGLVESADGEDFFFYTNRHALTKFREIKHFDE
ncbi:ribonucleotide-diphosphate reductase subunit beta [Lactobacillus hominis]|uniref:ribonucleoside-diphosphate reductase n=1 Tax=Lactobacillus hominis DSM 23910 = CRBIP 24.179 TaxID=1423758 RepID=I7KHX5_9LACO|nr:ribonucleotide-diphosphate reductase subunit beta [Lactobacillus hominis]KRM85130.1 ribonucleotide-diphosphate reductase subunit beta [Lactobacillus hominis DSM 23910 = CRBIP 24.179]MCT3348290.1 ribonucleotide-diphosphate reductase subunit beta [Lactobacillus hominis]CCI82490.1 Ribonucleotide-diphosphate reductase subunit beta [Lactobacillus hominis DSM 23910 = CRBIP 24.179]